MKLSLKALYEASYKATLASSQNIKLENINIKRDELYMDFKNTVSLFRDLCALDKNPETEKSTRDFLSGLRRAVDFYNLGDVTNTGSSSFVSIGGYKSFVDACPDVEIDLDKNPKLFMWSFEFLRDAVPRTVMDTDLGPFYSNLFPKNEFQTRMKSYIEYHLDNKLYPNFLEKNNVNNHFPETREILYLPVYKTQILKAFKDIIQSKNTLEEKIEVCKVGISSSSNTGISMKKVIMGCAEILFDEVYKETKDFEKTKVIVNSASFNKNYYKNYPKDLQLLLNKKAEALDISEGISLDEQFTNKDIPSYSTSSFQQRIGFDSSIEEHIEASATRTNLVILSLTYFVQHYANQLGLEASPGTLEEKSALVKFPNLKKAVELEPIFQQMRADLDTFLIPKMLDILDNSKSTYPNNSLGAKALGEKTLEYYNEFLDGRNAYYFNIDLNKNMERSIKINDSEEKGVQFKL